MKEPFVRPTDVLSIIMEARKIPNEAIVTKRTGGKEYMLRRDLKVYPITESGDKQPPLTINGFFLTHEGTFNQIAADTVLVYRVRAHTLMALLENSLENEQDNK